MQGQPAVAHYWACHAASTARGRRSALSSSRQQRLRSSARSGQASPSSHLPPDQPPAQGHWARGAESCQAAKAGVRRGFFFLPPSTSYLLQRGQPTGWWWSLIRSPVEDPWGSLLDFFSRQELQEQNLAQKIKKINKPTFTVTAQNKQFEYTFESTRQLEELFKFTNTKCW